MDQFTVLSRGGQHYTEIESIKTVVRHGCIVITHKAWVELPGRINPKEVDAVTHIPVYRVVSLVNAILSAVDAPEDVNVYSAEMKQSLKMLDRIEQLEEENKVLRMAMQEQ